MRKRPPDLRRLRAGLHHGRQVHGRLRLALNEARNRPLERCYRLREGGLEISLRHRPSADGRPSDDVWVLGEVFGEVTYEPPAAVTDLLARHADGLRVVDLGANIGLFGAFVLARYPRAHICAFEPEPDNARLLRTTIARSGKGAAWQMHEAAAAPADGWLEFAHDRGGRSHIADGAEERTIRIRATDVFPHLEDIDLLKVDIEGGEWALLADERMERVRPRTLVLEYHSYLCPSQNPKREALMRLSALGYTTQHMGHDESPDEEPFWGAGVVWAWRS